MSQFGKDVVIVARLRIRPDGAMHRDQQRVSRGSANVLALQSDGRRQYDISVPGARGPCRVVENDRIRAGEGLAQPVQILMVVEGIAAGPVDQLYIGVSEP